MLVFLMIFKIRIDVLAHGEKKNGLNAGWVSLMSRKSEQVNLLLKAWLGVHMPRHHAPYFCSCPAERSSERSAEARRFFSHIQAMNNAKTRRPEKFHLNTNLLNQCFQPPPAPLSTGQKGELDTTIGWRMKSKYQSQWEKASSYTRGMVYRRRHTLCAQCKCVIHARMYPISHNRIKLVYFVFH